MIIIGILLTLLGLILISSFLFSIIKCKTETPAVIEKIIVKKRYSRGINIKYCTPVFSYTVNNKKYTTKADFFTLNSKKYFVGQNVIVYTDVNNPNRMRYGSNISFCIEGLAFSALGIFIIILTFI